MVVPSPFFFDRMNTVKEILHDLASKTARCDIFRFGDNVTSL